MKERISGLYSVSVNGQEMPVQKCFVSAIPFNCIWPGHQRPEEQREEAAFVNCESDGTAHVTVRPARAFEKCVVRPLSRKIVPVVENGVISFDAQPGQYTVELDGRHHALHLFIDQKDSLERFRKDADLYFGPGLHELGRYELRSNMKIFIDRGAVVFGAFYGWGIENISITGYGIISGEHDIRTQDDPMVPCKGMGPEWPTGAIQIFEGRNIHIEGITFMDAAFWTMTFCNSQNIVMDNIKHIGMWRYNSDGMDLISTKNVVVRNSFFRNFDDVIVPNGRTPWDRIPTEDLLVENCICWCDWGCTLEVGIISRVDEIRNLIFRNCDLIHNNGNCLNANNGWWADIHDLTFEDIRVEYSKDCLTPVYQKNDDMVYEPVEGFMAPLVKVEIYNMNNWDFRRGRNYDLYFRDIHVLAEEGLSMPEVVVRGLNEKHMSWDVYFENITFNGQRVTTAEELNLKTNDFTGAVYLDGKRIH